MKRVYLIALVVLIFVFLLSGCVDVKVEWTLDDKGMLSSVMTVSPGTELTNDEFAS